MAAGAIQHAFFMAGLLVTLGTNLDTEDVDATSLVQLPVTAGGSRQHSRAPATSASQADDTSLFFQTLDPQERIKILQCILGDIQCNSATRASGYVPTSQSQFWPEFPCVIPGIPCAKGGNPPLGPGGYPDAGEIVDPVHYAPQGDPMKTPAQVLGEALQKERSENNDLLMGVIEGGASLTSLKMGSDAALTEAGMANTEYQKWFQEERRLDSVEAQELAVEHEYYTEDEKCTNEKTKLQVEVEAEESKLMAKMAKLDMVKKAYASAA